MNSSSIPKKREIKETETVWNNEQEKKIITEEMNKWSGHTRGGDAMPIAKCLQQQSWMLSVCNARANTIVIIY